jgi:chromosome partitioning protein
MKMEEGFMPITGASYEGGVDKTMTAVHLAASLQTLAPTPLLDGDDRNATAWSQRREGCPFEIAGEVQAARYARDYTPTVIDTGQRPKQVELQPLSDGCDLLITPAVPASLDVDGLALMLQALQDIGNERYRRQRRRRERKLV